MKVRTRITLVATLVTALVLGATGVVIVVVQRQQLLSNLDNTLALRADDLVPEIVADGADHGVFTIDAEEDRLAQLVTLDGEVIAANAVLAGADPLTDPPTARQRTRTLRGVPIEDDAYRILSRRIDTADGILILHLGENIDDLVDTVRILTVSLAVAIPFVVGVLGTLVWWLVGRTLRPVEAIRAEVADIGGGGLHRRVPAPDTNDEIARLATTMNAMLDRLENATRRQQQFASDASHELRSPITRIRSEVEVALAHFDDTDPRTTLASVIEETTGMQRLVADLLHLARSDAGLISAEREPVDLDDIVFREAELLRAEGHTINLAGVSAAHVIGDRGQLTRAVRNLMENAVRHATAATELTLAERDGTASLSITDDGPGVAPENRERIFERFTRLDDARTRDTGGSGLGLAITRDIIEAHGGHVSLDADHSPGARFIVTLPAG